MENQRYREEKLLPVATQLGAKSGSESRPVNSSVLLLASIYSEVCSILKNTWVLFIWVL